MSTLFEYKQLLGQLESSNNYKAVNESSGALGRYQFIPSTLNALESKYNLPSWISAEYFLNSPMLQETYFEASIKDVDEFIRANGLTKYLGRRVTGSKRFQNITSKITMYGMHAAAHLSGAGNLKRYFTDNYDPNDGQTSLTDYMAYFSKHLAGVGYLIPVLALAFLSLYLLYYD